MRNRLNVISHRVTLNLQLEQGPNSGCTLKPEVGVSLREYVNTLVPHSLMPQDQVGLAGVELKEKSVQ